MATPPDPAATGAAVKPPIIIDLGKHRKKRVKDLRKGTGRLADDVSSCLEELRAAGTLGASSQAVVVIVRERRKKNNLKTWIPGL